MPTRRTLTLCCTLFAALCTSLAHAGGVVSTCNEASLDAAVAGGGTVTFTCSGTIALTATIDITVTTTIDGTGQNVTISGGNAVQIFNVSITAPNSQFTLKNLVLINGLSQSHGGAIVDTGGSDLNIIHCTFSGNTAVGNTTAVILGGAIYYAQGTANISDSAFTNNVVIAGVAQGGALSAGVAVVNITNTTFSSNQAIGSAGATGGSGGEALGGAIDVEGSRYIIQNSTFSDNKAMGGSGGNGASGGTNGPGGNGGAGGPAFGGAISSNGGGELDLTNSTFSGNSALGGSGGSGGSSSVGQGGNGSFGGDGRGGAIYAFHTSIQFTTIASNQAQGALGGSGGTGTTNGTGGQPGMSVAGGFFGGNGLSDSIISSNSNGNCDGATQLNGAFNLSSDVSCLFAPQGNIQNTDPRLAPLANNGGPTQTMALITGSPAIGEVMGGSCILFDQRGYNRVTCDAGAYAYKGFFSLPTILISDVRQQPGTTFNFPVSLSAITSQTVTVSYSTMDGTATVANGDYVPTSGTLVFNPAVMNLNIPVQVNTPTGSGPTKTFSVVLSNPTNAVLGVGAATGYIPNDIGYPLIAHPRAIHYRPGKRFTFIIASFRDTDPNPNLSDFTGSVNWGDGVTEYNFTNFTFVGDGKGGFDVIGTHTYTTIAVYNIQVQINDAGGATASVSTPATMFPLPSSH